MVSSPEKLENNFIGVPAFRCSGYNCEIMIKRVDHANKFIARVLKKGFKTSDLLIVQRTRK